MLGCLELLLLSPKPSHQGWCQLRILLYKDKYYVGLRRVFKIPSMKKLTRGMHLDLNTADSLALLRVPASGQPLPTGSLAYVSA